MIKQTLLEKQAQERGFLNKLRERANISGSILEKLNPEFEKMMNNLRSTDEKSREIAANLKQLVSSSKTAVKNRDYLAVAMYLGSFHERLRYISHGLQKFVGSVNLKHYDFLLSQFDDSQKEKLFSYNPTKDIAAEEAFADDTGIIVSAQMTFWNPLENESEMIKDVDRKRQTTMKAIEKRLNTSFMKDLKTDSISILNSSIRFLKFTIALFKKLATALATRNMKDYIKFANLFTDRLNEKGSFHEEFVKYYTKNIMPLKAEHAKMLAAKQEAERQEEENKSKQLEVHAPKDKVLSPSPEFVPPGVNQGFPRMPKNMKEDTGEDFSPLSLAPTQIAPSEHILNEISKRSPYSARPTAPGLDSANYDDIKDEEEEPASQRITMPGEQKMPMPFQALNVASFIAKLEKTAASKNPKILVMEILAFSETIENSNPNESLQLLAIAEGIMEDYKQAGLFDNLNNMPKPANDPSKPLGQKAPVAPTPLKVAPNVPATITPTTPAKKEELPKYPLA